MKRVLLSIVATIVGLIALLSFKTQGHPKLVGSASLPAAALPGSSSSAPASPSGSIATTAAAPPDPAPAAETTPPGSPAATTPTPTSTAPKTFLGSAIQTPYGVVQVRIVVANKKITNVSFAQLTAYDSRSQQINSDAAPILLQETLSAQSAQIDSVSGASYTSDGYVQSLQSAIDQANNA